MKKSIMVIFFFSILFFYKSAAGQSCDSAPYRHIYYNKGFNRTQVSNFFFTSNNDIYLAGFTNQDAKNSNVDGWLMRTTFHGTPLWSKAIGTNADETINNIRSTKSKGYIFAGDTKYGSSYGTCWLARVDSSGNPVWSLQLKSANGSLYQVEELDNGDFIAVGTLYLQFKGDGDGNITSISHSSNFIIRTDSNGKVIWQRSFYHDNKELLRRVIQMPDGDFIATGIVLDSSIAYVLKINQYTGGLIWSGQYEKPDNYNYVGVKENNDGSMVFRSGNSVYFLTADGRFKPGSYQVYLVSGGKPIKGQAQDMGASGVNEIYYANIKPNPVVYSVNSAKAVQWAHIYNFNSSKDLSLAHARIYKNNIYLSGSYRANNISDTASNEQQAYLLKASMNGETFCSDTSNIISKISNIPEGTNPSYIWTNEGAVTPEFITIYSKNIEPVRMQDCTQQSCCNDVAITHKDEICDNSTYKLPDGSIATKPGFYTARMNTLKGCDSIIYTILSPEKQIDLSLSSDTCLKDNKPVVFSLPEDSSVRYRWQDGNTNTQYMVNFPGKYWVTATSACKAVTDSVNVHDNCAPPVFIPSAFTPNNDGLNDVFRIPDINGQHFINLNIYNRFGQLIFQSEDPHKGWDGTINNSPQAPGTYIYLLNYSDIEGNPHLLKGTLVLIR